MNTIEIQEEICVITLNNKPNNYLERPEFVSVIELQKKVLEHACKAIIIRGAGRHFSAGADVEQMRKMVNQDSIIAEMTKGKELLAAMQSFNIPIVTAVEGVCFGGGLEIVLASDIRIASSKCLFAFPEANLELIPGLGGTIHLPKYSGIARSLEMILKGDIIDCQTAHDIDIIDFVVDAKTTFDFAMKMLSSMVKNRSMSVIKAVVESVRNAESKPYAEALARETELFCELAKNAVEDE
ncbi:MAG: hypothetical protein DRI84_05295 [Bacteroidetes bacterium]|nr:MAG: hypothetical protein DRI84_05295 [Bacteroidota bacterium]